MSEFLYIAIEVMRKLQQPLTPQAIWRIAEDSDLVPDKLAGKTPVQTLKSKLSVHIRTHGEDSLFVRTAPGKFYLRTLLDPGTTPYQAPASEPPAPAERVLAFRTDILERLGRFQGIRTRCSRLYRELLRPRNCTYIPRQIAEATDSHKQVVTYVMVTSGKRLLAFKRGNYTRTDKFLRGSHCVGFGGHVIETDFTLFNTADSGVRDSAIREIAEELIVPAADRQHLSEKLELVGALNDDSSEVGRRHFAFVFRYEVESAEAWNQPHRGEKAVTELRWLTPAERDFSIRHFEYWSQLCLRTFFAEYVRAEPSFLIRRRMKFTHPHLLCILGPVGSGKTEATLVFTSDYGYTEINSGVILAELLGIPPVPVTPRLDFQRAALRFIESPTGPRRLAEAIWGRRRAAGISRLLVDGIRNRSTLKELQTLAGRQRLARIYVHTPADIAFNFYSRRRGPVRSLQDFLAARQSPVEREVMEMIEDADAVLYNWTGKMQYRRAVRGMMRELGINP